MKMHDCFDGLIPAIHKKGVTGVAGVTSVREAKDDNDLATEANSNTNAGAGVPRVSATRLKHLPPAPPHEGVSGQVLEISKDSSDETPATRETPWREQYEERAGMIEFEAGFPREKAEVMAYWDTFAQFAQRRHPALVAEFEAQLHRPLN